MKKVAIVIQKMVMGGIEKSLIEILKEMPEDEYEIDLYVFQEGGELANYIPRKVNIISIFGKEKSAFEKVFNKLKKVEVLKAIKLFYNYFMLLKITKQKGERGENYLMKVLPTLKKEYDVAITYMWTYSYGVRFTIDKLKAKRKMVWIHGETTISYENDVSNEKKEWHEKYYKKYNDIICVCKDNKKDFLNIFPSLNNKTKVFYNIINQEEIKKLAQEKIDLLKKGNEVVITTVGRLCEQKGQDRIIIILDELLKLGYNIRWFLVGDGDLREKLEIEIKNKKLEENLILLGTKLNPYPYIKNCDIYVQPSRSEGYCLTLAEAKILEKPIVVTEFAGSFEQIENQINRIRVKNQNKDILDGIIYLLENENIKIELEENLKKSNLNLAVKDNNIRNLI